MQTTANKPTLDDMAAMRDRSGSLWLVQAFTGLLLVIILGMHMIAHHYVVEGGLRNYQQVLDYVANPIVFIISLLFVVVGVVHAVLGLRAILIDMRPSAGVRRAAEWALGILAAVSIVYGIWLSIALQRLAG